MSAAKIAKLYGLKYASAKTAESTILYHLKRNGIRRRDSAAHVRKVTEEMVDGWVERYSQGESLKRIAGGIVDPVTVFVHLKKRGTKLRDKVEAQIQAVTKHQKKPFSGSESDGSYLIGFAFGDLDVVRHGRAIRARTSTTHPEMAKLFDDLFGRYGFVHRYPREAEWTGYEWSLEVDLENSFEFLLRAKQTKENLFADEQSFLSFLAGFFDAEGSIYLHKKRFGEGFEAQITNTDEELLKLISRGLESLGYHPRLYHRAQHARHLGQVQGKELWVLKLHRIFEVCRLLETLPLRHGEKREKARLVVSSVCPHLAEQTVKMEDWDAVLEKFKNGRDRFVQEAEAALKAKRSS